MLTIDSALCPQIIAPGLEIQVYQGSTLLNGLVVNVPTSIVGLAPNKTTYVFLNISNGFLQTNNTGFPINNFPIAAVTATIL
jgi:hypothetical protein